MHLPDNPTPLPNPIRLTVPLLTKAKNPIHRFAVTNLTNSSIVTLLPTALTLTAHPFNGTYVTTSSIPSPPILAAKNSMEGIASRLSGGTGGTATQQALRALKSSLGTIFVHNHSIDTVSTEIAFFSFPREVHHVHFTFDESRAHKNCG